MVAHRISVFLLHTFLLSQDTMSTTRNVRLFKEKSQVDDGIQPVVNQQKVTLAFGMLWGHQGMRYPTYLPYIFNSPK